MSALNVETNRHHLKVKSQQERLPGQYPDASAPLTPNTSTQLSLAQAVNARRAEYTKPRTTRIKVGSWNVAAHKSIHLDIGEWFVKGKGIAEHLTGPSVPGHSDNNNPIRQTRDEELESVGEQEARHRKKQPTVPKHDPGLEAGGEDIGLYVLGLQEVVDINSAVEALRPFSDAATSSRIKTSLEQALPLGYQLVAEQQLVGLLLLVYASPDVTPLVHSVSTTSVGTGLMGYMGNKGAVTARLVIGELTRLVFVNSHMSAGTSKAELERRHWDVSQIISRTRFDPITDGLGIVQEQGERIGDEDHAFWFGDLNYRLEGMPPDDVRKILMLHVRNEYDIGRKSQRKVDKELASSNSIPASASSPVSYGGDGPDDASVMSSLSSKVGLEHAEDPASLQATINSLMAHDELRQSQKLGKVFADWREGDITFLPTYKYDVGSVGVFDSGEKKRGPSWCDRILYRSRKDRLQYEERLRRSRQIELRDAEMKSQSLDTAAEDERTMFEYDPDRDADEEYDEPDPVPGAFSTSENVAAPPDDLFLESYMSHQRVLSADHKPLDAVFTLTFDAAVPELKTRVQQEVARELDRMENEGRPVLTVVADGSLQGDDSNFNGIHFGDLRYNDPKLLSVTLANTGRVPTFFGFVSQPPRSENGQKPSSRIPKWLSINFDIPSVKVSANTEERTKATDAWDADVETVFKLEPGETANVDLLSYIKDKDVLRQLNSRETMEDILVLRVKDGRDHFLPVRGTCHHSVHGRPLDALTRLPEGGIRALQNQKPSANRDHFHSRSTEDDISSLSVRWSAPREIFRLTEAIENLVERLVAEWSMLGQDIEGQGLPPWFKYAGWPFVHESWTLDEDRRQTLTIEINEALDTDKAFDAIFLGPIIPLHRLEVFVDVLLDLLGNLPDGIVTEELWTELESRVFPDSKTKTTPSLTDMKAEALEVLSKSQSHSISFLLLTSMLTRVSHEIASSFASPAVESSAPPTVLDKLPSSPMVKVRRKTLNSDTGVARRQLMNENLAAVFANVLIHIPASDTTCHSSSQTGAD